MSNNYVYQINPGSTIVGVRQTIVGAGMTGVAPTIEYAGPPLVTVSALPAKFENGLYTYVDPDDLTSADLKTAGLFDFNENYCLGLKCIRAFCGGGSTYSVFVQDRDTTNVVDIELAKSAHSTNLEFDHAGIIILPGQTLKITTTAAGTIDVYVARYEY